MPYFIFAVQPFASLEQLGACATFPEASREVKLLRAAQPPGEPKRIRIVFADDPIAAEDLLLAPRDAPPDGDD
jgi:hypothetical protein